MTDAHGNKITETFTFAAALDNYAPVHRSQANGSGEVWTMHDGRERLAIVDAEDLFKDAFKALYLLDDGSTVTPYYVAGYNPVARPGVVFLQTFPVNGGIREDNGRPANFDTWMLGPARTYHLKITRTPVVS
jgi:hypothetical protein